jgi:hypothetical protein
MSSVAEFDRQWRWTAGGWSPVAREAAIPLRAAARPLEVSCEKYVSHPNFAF